MLPSFGHASRVLLSGLLAGGLILGLTTAAESQSSKAKPKKPEATPEACRFFQFEPFALACRRRRAAAGQEKRPVRRETLERNEVARGRPFRGGRAIAIEGVPDEPNTYYFGGVAGGVWKTTDGGQNWKPMFDKQHTTSSIGAIAVAPSDHNTIYAGAGESALRGNITYGDGVYKSVDGGRNWRNVGLKDTRHIGALIVHPENKDIVFVAAVGHAYGPNAERGVFRTTDGGKSWTKVLFKDENTGAIDLVFDPHNPNTLFAAMYQVRRQPWFLSSGGEGSGSIVRPTAARPGNN